MINKDTLRHLVFIGSKNSDITKIFIAGRHLVARFIKHHRLTDILREPEDDNAILQMLLEVHTFQKKHLILLCCRLSPNARHKSQSS